MLIDFDAQFANFMSAWLEQHQDEYEHADQIEAFMPELYRQFCRTKADWLQGLSPQEYFMGFRDGKQLVRLMEQYVSEEIPLPDLLLERIEALGIAAQAPLFDIVKDEVAVLEARMLAMNLLTGMASGLPLNTYIAWQLERDDDDELADAALEGLEAMETLAIEAMLEALPMANETGREALLSVLSRYPGTAGVYEGLMHLFAIRPDRQAVLAAYLGRFGDERAVPFLQERAMEEGLSYLDYIELRAAIEALGGEAPERTFEDDPQYDALWGLM